MNINQWLEKKFGIASKGIIRSFEKLKGFKSQNNGEVNINGLKVQTEYFTAKNDSYKIKVSKSDLKISASNVTGFLCAIKELEEQLQIGSIINSSKSLLFKRRLYKLETSWDIYENTSGKDATNRIMITEQSDKYWHSLFQNISARGFNVLVLYAGAYHPFEHFLDYKDFPQGINPKSKSVREKNFKAFSNMLKIAKEYGLETFMQHYVSHFTQALSDHLKLGLKEGGSRLANFDHPEIDAYNRYIYQRTFETLPELDGLFFNFESCGNSKEFLKRTLIKAIAKLKRKPILQFRLWGISDINEIKDVVELYDGPVRLMHKSHDTNDIYYYPTADERIKYWKEAMPNVEFTYSMGPCHNCATNLSSKAWTDPEYINQLMSNMLAKGADSVSFQASYDVLTYFVEGTEKFTDFQKSHSKVNFGHLEAFCDFVHQKKPSDKEWGARYAKVFEVSQSAGQNIYTAIVHGSRIMMKQKWQQCEGSFSEGYLFPSRFSFYQEPFFYYPMSSINTLGEIKYNLGMGAWLKRTKKVKTVPNDTMYSIDYVNPAVKKKTKNNPFELARQIKEHIRITRSALQSYKRQANKNIDKNFVSLIELNINWGERAWRELYIGIQLYSCYFAKSKKSFFDHLKNAHKLMLDTCKNVDIKASQQFININGSGNFTPDKDAIEIKQIIDCEKVDVPFEALKHHLQSHTHYNEIRRLSRPYASVRNEVIPFNANLIRKAITEAEKALTYLEDPKYSLFHSNVYQWLNYLNADLQNLIPPAMNVYPDDKIPKDAQFHKFTHDQCFLHGERCWDDFHSFFYNKNYFRQDNIDCRATYTKDGIIISMREHGINWAEREATWAKNKGTINQTGFMQIYIEDGVTCKKSQNLTLFFKGEGGTQLVSMEGKNYKQTGTKPEKLKDYSVNFEHTDSWWRVDVTLPWKRFSKKPKPGDVWRLNILSNPAVIRNHRGIWCQGFEMFGDISRLGYIHFS